MRATLATIRNRLVSDFLMGSRLDDYRHFLESALEAGYQVHSVGSAWKQITEGGFDPARRHLVLRHDVDTDPRTAAAMWDIDHGLAIDTAYFFRLSTVALDLMARIAAAGGEASYHYEELTSVAKRLGIASRAEADRHIAEARDRFAENLYRLRATTGLPMRVVASHGDFVNRRLGASNWLILADPEFRRSVGVDLDTYDDEYLRHLPRRYTDAPYPRFWEPADPAAAVKAGEPVISVLVHPRHWRVDRAVNGRDDVGRVVEGLQYGLRVRSRGGRRG